MDENMMAAVSADEVVFKIKRSAIAEVLRSDFEMPIPVTDANIDVVVNQIASLIEEFSTGVPTEFFDLGIDHHKGIDFYRKVYGIFDGRRCGLSWSSEDKSLVYFAVADEANGLTVFHIPSAALAQIDRRDQGDLGCINGAVQDFHVDDAYAENDRVLEFARNSPAAAEFGLGGEQPEFGFYGAVYLYRDLYYENGKIDFSAAVDKFAFKAGGRDLAALRRLSDEELATETEKASVAMTELVDAHMSHVHGLGGTEDDSDAYYAAQKRYSDLKYESARRLHASLESGQKESARDPQAIAAAATKVAQGRDEAGCAHGNIKH